MGKRSGWIVVALALLAPGWTSAVGEGSDDLPPPAGGHPVPGKAFVIPDLRLELVWIEPGTFRMGSPPEEPQRHPSEGPQFEVTLSHGFWLGRTEVTQEQYQALTGKNPSHFQDAGPEAPVERVSWVDAMAFARELSRRERAEGRLPAGWTYTLPTEAQWEYACRAGTTAEYVGDPNALAWYDRNSSGRTHPVATKEPNPWGLYDMTGNVVEWCLDWYGEYPRHEVTDPVGPRRGYYRIARGGSWRAEARVGRSAARGGGSTEREDYTLGFRLALSRSGRASADAVEPEAPVRATASR